MSKFFRLQFSNAGHEEDETEDEAGKENRPGAIQIWFHFSKLELLTASRASQNQIRQRFKNSSPSND